MPSLEFNDRAASAAIERIMRAMADPRPVMDEIGVMMAENTMQRFVAGTAPDGTPWAAKSEVTKAQYEQRGEKTDQRPLWHRGVLATNSIFHQSTRDSVSWGSGLIYAAMMQFGGTKDQFPHLWGDIPARPFLGLSDEDRSGIEDVVAEWLEGLAAP